MQFLAAMILPTVTCILLTWATSYFWWSRFQSPWQYATFAFLTTLGLHRLIQAVAELIKNTTTFEGYIIARRDRPNFAELALETLTIEALLVSLVLVAGGIPLLAWLRDALPKAA